MLLRNACSPSLSLLLMISNAYLIYSHSFFSYSLATEEMQLKLLRGPRGAAAEQRQEGEQATPPMLLLPPLPEEAATERRASAAGSAAMPPMLPQRRPPLPASDAPRGF